MAEWDSVVVGGRSDMADIANDGDEHTFDLGKFGRAGSGNFEDQSRSVHNFCYNCRTVARIAPKGIAPSKEQFAGCHTEGCPGYSARGGPFATSVEAEESSSDESPLLFSNSSSRKDFDPTIDSGPSSEEMGTMDHCHTYSSSADVSTRRQRTAAKARKKLLIAVFLTMIFVMGEVIGGYMSDSLAIMTDAAHMLSDLGSFIVGLLAIKLGSRPGGKKYSFGYHRAEALGALFTVVIIWYVTGVLVYLAAHRISTGDFEVDPIPMMAVAASAVLFNIVLGFVLHGVPHSHSHGGGGGGGSRAHSHLHHDNDGSGGESGDHKHSSDAEHLNVRAAMIHVLGDLIQSVGVLISSILIFFDPGLKMADPVCTVIFSFIVFCTTINVVRDTVRILMEGCPKSVSFDDVMSDLMNLLDVVLVHDLRIWSLTTDKNAVSVHLAVNPTGNSEKVLQAATKLLKDKHDIHVVTVQVELYKPQVMNTCESCQPLI